MAVPEEICSQLQCRFSGGRKRAETNDPALLKTLLGLVEPDERGDPQSPLRWTTKSLRNLAEELTRQGHPVSAPTVGRLLKQVGFSLQANVKTLEGAQHPDRDAQFRYINEQVKQHQADGEPVVSVDTKKRGRPLTSHEVVIETIAATRTRAGLRVEAHLDPGDYPTGIAISKDRFAALPLVRHEVHGQWNYALLSEPPASQVSPTAAASLSPVSRTRA